MLLTGPNNGCIAAPGIHAVNDDNFTWVPDGSVDLVLSDPPFNIAQETNFHTWGENSIHSYKFDDNKDWDTYGDDEFVGLLHQWAAEFARVLRPGGNFAVFCADVYISHFMTALEAAGLHPRRVVTWRKPNAVPINRKRMPMSSCEYVITGIKKPGPKAIFRADLPLTDVGNAQHILPLLLADKAATIADKAVRQAVAAHITQGEPLDGDKIASIASEAFKGAAGEVHKRVGDIFVDDGDGEYARGCIPNIVTLPSRTGSKRIHPTEKPVQLLEYFIALLSSEGETILDPFAGSGSLGEAAFNTGRSAILVERDTEFYGKLVERLGALAATEDASQPDELPFEA